PPRHRAAGARRARRAPRRGAPRRFSWRPRGPRAPRARRARAPRSAAPRARSGRPRRIRARRDAPRPRGRARAARESGRGRRVAAAALGHVEGWLDGARLDEILARGPVARFLPAAVPAASPEARDLRARAHRLLDGCQLTEAERLADTKDILGVTGRRVAARRS